MFDCVCVCPSVCEEVIKEEWFRKADEAVGLSLSFLWRRYCVFCIDSGIIMTYFHSNISLFTLLKYS